MATKLVFGLGNIKVVCFGESDGVAYGVAFQVVPENHHINEKDVSVIGLPLGEMNPDVQLEFLRAESAQVVINKLVEVRDSLMEFEKGRPVKKSWRLKLADFLFRVSCVLGR